jgi:2-polyprenyl-6-methoxyphenol hydroxylase-like FAD-dependent oxidoreductase
MGKVREGARAEYDAVVVGASLAGCTAAILLARAGARVALVEKQPDPAAFKRICSHFIQSSAVATIERLGLMPELEEAGAVRTRFRMWTRWGWILSPADTDFPASLNLRREKLDPLLRETAARTPGVELLQGRTTDELIEGGGRFRGVVVRDRHGTATTIHARLVVGADGRDSRVAELAGVHSRQKPHGRFAYGAYYEGPPPSGSPDATVWMLDPDWAAAFPTDSGLTFYACMPEKSRLPQFRGDPGSAMEAFLAELPEAPPIQGARRVSPVLGKLEMPNVMRGPTAPGLALIGDAAYAADPLWGVGCGWALQSAEWLADSASAAVRGDEALERALNRYRRRYSRALRGHAFMMDDYATGRRMTRGERLVFSAAPHDPGLAGLFEAYGTRNMRPARFLRKAVPRALAAHGRRRLMGPRRRAEFGSSRA